MRAQSDVQTRIDAAQVEYDKAVAEGERHEAKWRAVLTAADAAEREAVALTSRRQELLLPALQEQDAAAAAELAELPARIADAERRARDGREAAALLKPAIEEFAPTIRAAGRTLSEAQYLAPYLAHHEAAARLDQALADLEPLIDAWVETDAQLRTAHREAFGVDTGLAPARQRLGWCLWFWGRTVCRDFAWMFSRVWPEAPRSLVAPLAKLRGAEVITDESAVERG